VIFAIVICYVLIHMLLSMFYLRFEFIESGNLKLLIFICFSAANIYAGLLRNKLNNLTRTSNGLGHLMVLITSQEWYLSSAFLVQNCILFYC
jgi:hypothetical protein